MKQIEVTLGIDIGGTNTAFGLVSSSGEILMQSGLPTCDGPCRGSVKFL